MLHYDPKLKNFAQSLRTNQTKSEQQLWSKLRGKQLHGVQFYRQKPLGHYIVDFYAPRAKLVIEVDGSQHQEADQQQHDAARDHFLRKSGLQVLRFDSRQVLTETDAVVQIIYETMRDALKG